MTEYQPSFLVLSTPHFNGEGLGSIPGSGTKISQALQQKKKKKKNKPTRRLTQNHVPEKWQS